MSLKDVQVMGELNQMHPRTDSEWPRGWLQGISCLP